MNISEKRELLNQIIRDLIIDYNSRRADLNEHNASTNLLLLALQADANYMLVETLSEESITKVLYEKLEEMSAAIRRNG